MKHRLGALCAFLALLFAVMFASPARASSQYYPNYNGPYYMSTYVYVDQPPNGSRYAYGTFNNCQVRFSSHANFVASRSTVGDMDTIDLSQRLDFCVGYTCDPVDVGSTTWLPRYPYDYQTLYCPVYMQNGQLNTGSGYTNITVPGGDFRAEGHSAARSRLNYVYGVSDWWANYSTCCDDGTCP